MIPVEGLERASRVSGPRDRRPCAVAIGDRAPQQSLVEAERAGEFHVLHAAERNEIEAQADATRARGRSVDPDVLEAAETIEVSDRLANVGHRQRTADVRFEQVRDRRIRRRLPVDEDLDLLDRSADVCRGVGDRSG